MGAWRGGGVEGLQHREEPHQTGIPCGCRENGSCGFLCGISVHPIGRSFPMFGKTLLWIAANPQVEPPPVARGGLVDTGLPWVRAWSDSGLRLCTEAPGGCSPRCSRGSACWQDGTVTRSKQNPDGLGLH